MQATRLSHGIADCYTGQDADRAKRTKVERTLVPVRDLRTSPENDKLYRPVDPDDPEIVALAASIRENGILEPLVVSLDRFIISGHRRLAAAKLARLKTVPVRTEPVYRCGQDGGAFVRLLREHNRQRDKSLDEKLREELVSVSPDLAFHVLLEFRRQKAAVGVQPMSVSAGKARCKISPAKAPLLEAVQAVLAERRRFWPLSDRQIHYALLNDPPLRHASKPDSRYANTAASYKDLVGLLTRGRLEGTIPFSAIADETRPVTIWKVHRETRGFVREELAGFLKGYWRDLQQSQANHIELVAEKNTVAPIFREVASRYCIPITTGRGYCSLPPRYEMAERFRLSGKKKLVLLLVTDHDPDGEEIASSFARSMRDDFRIRTVHPIKVALTADQVKQYALPPIMRAKKSSSQYQKFSARHGEDVFELEALQPAELQQILAEAIEAVLDRDAFDAEVAAEKRDATFLAGVRSVAQKALAGTMRDDMDEGS